MTERRPSVPNQRAANRKKSINSVRRRYKVDVHKQTRLLAGEIPHVKQMLVVLQLAGYNHTQKARIVGISRDQVREYLADPAVEEMLVILRERIPDAALELLQGYMIEAVQAIVDVMRRSGDDKTVIQAAADLLDRGGLPKLSKSEKHQTLEEKTTITDDGIVAALREASPEVQEQAAQLIEQLEGLLVQAATEPAEAEEPDA
jgi:hypothetical protein